ncbi:hypothetical protein EV401DRAFT_2193311, partial [Pisolithus croceorrhizus]
QLTSVASLDYQPVALFYLVGLCATVLNRKIDRDAGGWVNGIRSCASNDSGVGIELKRDYRSRIVNNWPDEYGAGTWTANFLPAGVVVYPGTGNIRASRFVLIESSVDSLASPHLPVEWESFEEGRVAAAVQRRGSRSSWSIRTANYGKKKSSLHRLIGISGGLLKDGIFIIKGNKISQRSHIGWVRNQAPKPGIELYLWALDTRSAGSTIVAHNRCNVWNACEKTTLTYGSFPVILSLRDTLGTGDGWARV